MRLPTRVADPVVQQSFTVRARERCTTALSTFNFFACESRYSISGKGPACDFLDCLLAVSATFLEGWLGRGNQILLAAPQLASILSMQSHRLPLDALAGIHDRLTQQESIHRTNVWLHACGNVTGQQCAWCENATRLPFHRRRRSHRSHSRHRPDYRSARMCTALNDSRSLPWTGLAFST